VNKGGPFVPALASGSLEPIAAAHNRRLRP